MNTPHYAYQTLFEITSPDSLTDFWSYIINRLDLKSSEYTYDRFARFYNRLNDFKDLISETNYIYHTS